MNFEITEKSIEPDFCWTKDRILSKITQEEIFEYYLEVKVKLNDLFCSPLRRDDNPTCSFKYMPSGKLLYRDWAEARTKDCFTIVQEMFNVDFYTALKIIARDFGLTEKDPEIDKSRYNKNEAINNRPTHSEKSIILVKIQNFTKTDAQYLKSYHLTKKIVNAYNVFSAGAVWINGKQVYLYTKDNPALAYYFGLDEKGNQKWKIYYYKSKKLRFLGNTNRINGWVQIPEKGEELIITKSMKDVMCLARFSIPSIAMQAETQLPYDYIIEEIKERYNKIYTLLDFDLPGIRTANKIKRLYDIPPLLLTNGRFGSLNFNYKDFSDFLQGNGVDEAGRLIEHAREQLEESVPMFPSLSN